ncbi:MAG: ABC transporter permease [Acidobacteria bacterium]|nr:MAG: ABC transporter permease [Acidobacteriota bacterium]PYV73360.1 MAG: ABC transporter permease [Acidobacteriota bacterium]PYV77252.1 MAG: ABC transporter permease [Acidobacteriota bacterium]
MAIPISYNIRNMKLRRGLTTMTALGIGLTVMTAVFLMMLLAGLKKAFVSSGDPLNVLVIRKGSNSELTGGFTKDKLPILRQLPGIALDSHGQPMTSGEWVVVVVLPHKDGTGEVNVTLRGMEPDGLELRRNRVKLVEGSWFQSGQREVALSRSIHDRFGHTNVGDIIDFGKGPWKVTGIFEAGGSAYDSEIWGEFNQVANQFNRQNAVGNVYLRATDSVAADALKHRVADDQQLQLEGMLETEYYEKQTSNGGAIRFVGIFVGLTMAIGSVFAAANTMYAAVSYRSREIATLRVMGFRRASIVMSFVFEAVLLALLGAAVGIVLMLPFNGMSTSTANNVTFSEVEFSMRITLSVVINAVVFAVAMGLIGGVAPAWNAARREILASLRD